MASEVLRITLPAILVRLKDPVDDVGAVAASALIPAAQTIVADFPYQVQPYISSFQRVKEIVDHYKIHLSRISGHSSTDTTFL